MDRADEKAELCAGFAREPQHVQDDIERVWLIVSAETITLLGQRTPDFGGIITFLTATASKQRPIALKFRYQTKTKSGLIAQAVAIVLGQPRGRFRDFALVGLCH